MRRQLTAGFLKLSHPSLWSNVQAMNIHQWLSVDETEERLHQKLTEVLRYAVAEVPRYRQLASEEGWKVDQVTHENLADFPLVGKTVMTEERDTFFAAKTGPEDRIQESTGGSSGVWFGFYYDRRTKEIRRATDFYGRMMAGWNPGDPMAVVWGHAGDVAVTSSWKGRLADTLLYRRITLNAYDMDEGIVAKYVARLADHRPRIMVGYASSLAFLAEYIGRTGQKDIRPVGIVSSAETLHEEQRSIIEAQFGCPVFNRYGSREFANIAQQCELGKGLHIYTNRIHVEILRPDGTICDPGETGEIVVTDLINGVMPFIRYRTGDMGSLSPDPCPCGRGFPVLSEVQGRVSEIIVGKNGKYYSCQSPRLFGDGIPGIEQMQVIQDNLELIEVKIVPGDSWADSSREMLTGRMKELLGDIRVEVTLTERIPPSPSGKYRFTISKVSPFQSSGPN